MMALNLFLTAYAVKLLAGIDPVLAIFEDHPCAAGQFKILGKNAETFIRCQTCYMCPPGYGVLQECTETSDTTCRRCPSGYFSDSSTRRGGCKKCRPCLDEEDTVRECTSNSNRECRHQCSPGDYLDEVTRRCLPCSFCHQTRNVRVTTNEQCSSQGLPEMWVCSSNITVTDDQGIISTFDTGDVYSYKAVSRRKHQGGHRNKIPPLDKFMIQRFEQRAETTPITSAAWSSTQSEETSGSGGTTLHEEVTPSHISTRSHTSLLSPQDQITRHANECETDGNCAYGGFCLAVTLTCVFFLLVIIMMGIILRDYHRDYKMKRKMAQWDDYQSKSRPQQYLTESCLPPPPPYSRRYSPSEKRPLCYLQGVETVV